MVTVTTSESSYINVDGTQVLAYIKNRSSQSNRNARGKVDTTIQSPLIWHRAQLVSWTSSGRRPDTGKLQPPTGARFNVFSNVPSNVWERAEQTALAKFRGKIKKGNAALGITLATLGQARDMVNGRLLAIQDAIARAGNYLSTKKGRKRLKSQLTKVAKKRGELTASQVLEGFFGWAPLIGDMRAVMNTLFQQGIPPQFVKGSHTFVYSASSGTPANSVDVSANCRVTLAACVQISNPNAWLASRAGVLNPAQVVWDLIPWSWLVNMFVNVNTLLGATTDFAGLSFSRQSVTKTGTAWISDYNEGYGNTVTTSVVATKGKTREVGSIPSPTLAFHVPELDVSLGLIASALIVQNMRKISLIIKTVS